MDFFSCYEAFIHIIDFHVQPACEVVEGDPPYSMAGVRSRRLIIYSHRTFGGRITTASATRTPASSIMSSTRRPIVIRIYLPPDANTLLSVADHCLRSRHYINVIIAGKQSQAQWLNMDDAVKHCVSGIGIWPWASNDADGETRCGAGLLAVTFRRWRHSQPWSCFERSSRN